MKKEQDISQGGSGNEAYAEYRKMLNKRKKKGAKSKPNKKIKEAFDYLQKLIAGKETFSEFIDNEKIIMNLAKMHKSQELSERQWEKIYLKHNLKRMRKLRRTKSDSDAGSLQINWSSESGILEGL